MTASIKQIAEASHVSIATASRALRGKGEISAETRKRVQAAAKQLKYRPNLLVKGIQTGRSQAIGVLMTLADAFLAHVFEGIQDTLGSADYAPIVLRVRKLQDGYVGPTELEQIHRLIERRVDGVILRPVEDAASDAYLREVWDRSIPLVAVDRRLPHTHADFVGSDDRGGARQAAEHLLSLGHRRFGHIAGPAFASTAKDRSEGFAEAVAECPGTTCQILEDPRFSDGYEQAVALLQRQPRPTAIFAANDLIADHVYRAAKDLGLRVPQDVSVVGFGGLEFGNWMQPKLTTVGQNARAIGRRAGELVLARIAGKVAQGGPQVFREQAQLIVRESTAAVEMHV